MIVDDLIIKLKKIKGGSLFGEAFCDILENCPDSTVLEFGVERGISLGKIASALPEAKVYGFDWFQGLTEDWWRIDENMHRLKGSMNLKKELGLDWRELKFPSNVKIVYGLIEETLIPFLKKVNPSDVMLIHFDCDTYTPHRHALYALTDIIKKQKPYMVFDDIIRYPSAKKHALKALCEFMNDNKDFDFRVLARGVRQVAIKPI